MPSGPSRSYGPVMDMELRKPPEYAVSGERAVEAGRLYRSGEPATVIAAMFGVSPPAVHRALREQGVPLRRAAGYPSHRPTLSLLDARMIQLLNSRNWSRHELGCRFGASPSMVQAVLNGTWAGYAEGAHDGAAPLPRQGDTEWCRVDEGRRRSCHAAGSVPGLDGLADLEEAARLAEPSGAWLDDARKRLAWHEEHYWDEPRPARPWSGWPGAPAPTPYRDRPLAKASAR